MAQVGREPLQMFVYTGFIAVLMGTCERSICECLRLSTLGSTWKRLSAVTVASDRFGPEAAVSIGRQPASTSRPTNRVRR